MSLRSGASLMPYRPSSEMNGRGNGSLTDEQAAMLLDGLKKSAEKTQNKEKEAKKVNFTPNPEAPAWKPDPRHKMAGMSDARMALKNQEGSGSSGDVILYTGRTHTGRSHAGGEQVFNQPMNMSMAPYQEPPFIRTPFGIVYGEYPTVEQNSQLPGGKVIPRDKGEWDVIDVQRSLAHLYDICKGYVANCHMHSPPKVPYNKLKDANEYTWHFMMQQVYKDSYHAENHLAYLLNAKAFVPYLLQRVCVDYLLKKILTPEVFVGFSDAMDAHLRALQTQLAAIHGTFSCLPLLLDPLSPVPFSFDYS